MRPHRRITKFYTFSVPALKPYGLTTTVDIAEDIYSALRYYVDVSDVGKKPLLARGISNIDVDSAFFAMQSFIRQSYAFYKVAREADPRSSPLNYYYAFLNLAKAVLCLEKPALVSRRI